jgi:pimeloyl-ACP methyl ester carboxylesterase
MFVSSQQTYVMSAFVGSDRLSQGANRPTRQRHADPIAFDGCLGFHHPAGGRCGIVMCGAWGYEELILRASWRRLADMLADSGFPCLRFDYPATGDSLGDPGLVHFGDWVRATERACGILRAAGVTDIVLLGHGIGSLVAGAAAARVGAAGLVLLAPVTGRRFLRRTAHWAAMVASTESVAPPVGDTLRIAGFTLPPGIQGPLQAMGGRLFEGKPADWALLVDPADGEASTFDDNLTAAGVTVQRLAFDGMEELLSGPTTARTPWSTYDAIVEALETRFPAQAPEAGRTSAGEHPARLDEDEFQEEAARFGPGGALLGILCTPRVAGGHAVIFTNTGRNPHTGWRRMSVEHARALAGAGIASLRFDATGIGDSADDRWRPPRPLYSEAEVADAVAAVDFLTERGFDRITVVGVCSGAYLALLAAVADKRIGGLVAINLPRFAWDPAESIDEAIRFANRPSDHTLKRLVSRDTLRSILTGRLDPRPAIAFRFKSKLRELGVALAPWCGRALPGGHTALVARARLSALLARGAEVFLGYSAKDGGFDELKLMFGPPDRLRAAHATLDIGLVAETDHNFSQDHACEWMLARIKYVVARQALPEA